MDISNLTDLELLDVFKNLVKEKHIQLGFEEDPTYGQTIGNIKELILDVFSSQQND